MSQSPDEDSPKQEAEDSPEPQAEDAADPEAPPVTGLELGIAVFFLLLIAWGAWLKFQPVPGPTELASGDTTPSRIRLYAKPSDPPSQDRAR